MRDAERSHPMLNRTELDVRVLTRSARISYAERFGALYDTPAPAHRPRSFAAAPLWRAARRESARLRVQRPHAATR
jgi:hypothetical protein